MSLNTALFLEAQTPVWDRVVAELTAGEKKSHWMWFVFPQLATLGRSPTALRYGIGDLSEASDYLACPQLRDRLEQVTRLVLGHTDKDPVQIFGPIDALKLRSSMTLFTSVPGAAPEFQNVIDTFFDGPCPLTIQALNQT